MVPSGKTHGWWTPEALVTADTSKRSGEQSNAWPLMERRSRRHNSRIRLCAFYRLHACKTNPLLDEERARRLQSRSRRSACAPQRSALSRTPLLSASQIHTIPAFMPQFIIRIQLHDAKGEDYGKLNSAMGHHGFLRTIIGTDGIVYLLPTAEYIRYGLDLTADKVRGDAVAGTSPVSRKFAVVVAETNGPIMWSGLERA